MSKQDFGWSAPFHGVQHLSGPNPLYWATVADHESFAVLSCRFPGCGFSPIESQHADAASARAAGEAYMQQVTA